MFIFIYSQAQIKLTLHELSVGDLKVLVPDSADIEGIFDGPYVSGTLAFCNITDSSILLDIINSNTNLRFRYRNKYYYRDITISNLEESVTLNPNECHEAFFSTKILLGTDLLKEVKNQDYLLEMFEILPTITIIYKEKKNKFTSCGIENVIVH
jgi:hypothetical protein